MFFVLPEEEELAYVYRFIVYLLIHGRISCFVWGYVLFALNCFTEISYQRKLTLVVYFLVTTRVHHLSHGAASVGFQYLIFLGGNRSLELGAWS